METQVHLPAEESPITINEVVLALKKQKLEAKHDKANWGDWINFKGLKTVIAIESANGLTTRATIEEAEGEDDTLIACISAFRKLGWHGEEAAGFFGAIACAEHSEARVLILEKTSQLLQKVKISGGGRCNVTHSCFEPKQLSQHYPRGEKSLIGAFKQVTLSSGLKAVE